VPGSGILELMPSDRYGTGREDELPDLVIVRGGGFPCVDGGYRICGIVVDTVEGEPREYADNLVKVTAKGFRNLLPLPSPQHNLHLSYVPIFIFGEFDDFPQLPGLGVGLVRDNLSAVLLLGGIDRLSQGDVRDGVNGIFLLSVLSLGDRLYPPCLHFSAYRCILIAQLAGHRAVVFPQLQNSAGYHMADEVGTCWDDLWHVVGDRYSFAVGGLRSYLCC
jgi:hypothetical protein